MVAVRQIDKGNMLAPILAIEALLSSDGKLPVNVKFFYEGQEEIGSPTIGPFIKDNIELLKADMIFSSDGGQWSEDQPSLVYALRGLVGCEITVTGASGDQHSGNSWRWYSQSNSCAVSFNSIE